MSESREQHLYVRVKDFAGNEFVCPIEALKGLKEVSEEILDNCVDDATVGRYAGNIRIKE
jgi:DNA gyrase/topoisomerase IV subunit B